MDEYNIKNETANQKIYPNPSKYLPIGSMIKFEDSGEIAMITGFAGIGKESKKIVDYAMERVKREYEEEQNSLFGKVFKRR